MTLDRPKHRKPRNPRFNLLRRFMSVDVDAPEEVAVNVIVRDLYTYTVHRVNGILVRKGREDLDALSVAKLRVQKMERHEKEHAFELISVELVNT